MVGLQSGYSRFCGCTFCELPQSGEVILDLGPLLRERRLPAQQDWCGGSGVTSATTDNFGNVSLAGPCKSHDGCYASASDRQTCDKNLRRDLYDMCISAGQTECGIMSASFYQAVRWAGWSFYVGSGVNTMSWDYCQGAGHDKNCSDIHLRYSFDICSIDGRI